MNYNYLNLKISYFPAALASLLLTVSLLVSSCTQGKVSQCKKIIATTKKMAEISQKSRQTEDLGEILKVAGVFEESAASLEKLDIADKKLSEARDKLAEIYRGNGESTREFVSAFQAKDVPRVSLAQQEVQILGKKEQQLVTEINEYCQE